LSTPPPTFYSVITHTKPRGTKNGTNSWGKKGMGLSSMNPPGTVIIMETHSYDISKFTRAGVIKFLDTFPPSKHISLKFQPRSGRNSSSIKSILELVILRHFKLPCLPHVNHRLFLFSYLERENKQLSVRLSVGWLRVNRAHSEKHISNSVCLCPILAVHLCVRPYSTCNRVTAPKQNKSIN